VENLKIIRTIAIHILGSETLPVITTFLLNRAIFSVMIANILKYRSQSMKKATNPISIERRRKEVSYVLMIAVMNVPNGKLQLDSVDSKPDCSAILLLVPEQELALPFDFVNMATAIKAPTKATSKATRIHLKTFEPPFLRRKVSKTTTRVYATAAATMPSTALSARDKELYSRRSLRMRMENTTREEKAERN